MAEQINPDQLSDLANNLAQSRNNLDIINQEIARKIAIFENAWVDGQGAAFREGLIAIRAINSSAIDRLEEEIRVITDIIFEIVNN